METRCKATNAAGNPCEAHVREGEDWCRWHDPARATDRAAWRKKGGEGKSNVQRMRKAWGAEQLSPVEIGGLLSSAMVATFRGEIEPGVLSALAGGARALIAVRESSDVESRLAALEAASGIEGKTA